MVTTKVLRSALGKFILMKKFPFDSDAKSELGNILCGMCNNDEELEWISSRIPALFAEWPGIGEVRGIFCKRYHPADGIEAYSTCYPERIPTDPAPNTELPDPRTKLISADLELQNTVKALAKGKRF